MRHHHILLTLASSYSKFLQSFWFYRRFQSISSIDWIRSLFWNFHLNSFSLTQEFPLWIVHGLNWHQQKKIVLENISWMRMADIDMDWIPSGWNCGLHKYNREKWLTTSWSNNNMKQRMIHVHCGSVVYTLRRPIINWTNSFHERSREHFVFVCVVWNKFESLLCAICIFQPFVDSTEMWESVM